ncbi:MAG: thioredoxin domain-containing protein, partial [Methyloligellaceae bacterium]
PATLNDYANMISAAIALHQTTHNTTYIDAATGWAAILDTHYWDETAGGYYLTADDTVDVILRVKSAADDAAPNGNGTMISALVHLFLLTGEQKHLGRAEALLEAFTTDVFQNPVAQAGLLSGALDILSPQHVVVLGLDDERTKNLLATTAKVSMPGMLLQLLPDASSVPKTSPTAGKTMSDGVATAYVCTGQTCSLPQTVPDGFEKILRAARLINVAQNAPANEPEKAINPTSDA